MNRQIRKNARWRMERSCCAIFFVVTVTCLNLFSSGRGMDYDLYDSTGTSYVAAATLSFPTYSSDYFEKSIIDEDDENEHTSPAAKERQNAVTTSSSARRPKEFLVTSMVEPDRNNRTRMSHTSEWDHAILETTKLLYRNSPPDVLQFWLSQPPPKVYIYNTVSANFSDVGVISRCVDHVFLGHNVTGTWVGTKKNCRWRPEICDDQTAPAKSKDRKFVSYRYNYNTDVAYLDKFNRYPHRTTDPSDADLFVVPYPHKSHCLCHKDFRQYSARCAVPFSEIESNVLRKLDLLNDPAKSYIPHSRERHVFFFGADWSQELAPFRAAAFQSITISLGPVLPCDDDPNQSCGHVTVPYLATDPDFQPYRLSEPDLESIWLPTIERPYLVGAALSSPKGLPLRGKFLKGWKRWIDESIDGKPHQIINMGIRRSGKKPTSRDFMQLYRNSTICLILPGDGCAQKRFFDVLLNGCIPLVPVFPSNDKDSPFSFHHSNGCSTKITYPFAKGTFVQDPSAGFDILDMVAVFNGTCGLPCLKSAIIDILSNKTIIEEKRRRLREYSSVIRFGLTDDSNGHPDAFSSLLVRLRHHVWHVLGRMTQ